MPGGGRGRILRGLADQPAGHGAQAAALQQQHQWGWYEGQDCTTNPYGDNLACASAQGWTNPLTFSRVHYAGYEYNGSTGLYHTWFREYDPRLGRFLQADPLGGDASDPQSLNRFAYTRNDPGNLVDPLGLEIACVTSISVEGGAITTCEDDIVGGGSGVGGGSDLETVLYALSRGGLRLIRRALTDSEARGSDGKGGLLDRLRETAHGLVCLAATPLIRLARANNATLGVGAGGSIGVGVLLGVAVSGGAHVVADTYGGVGIAITIGGNPGYGVLGIGALGGGQVVRSTAPTIAGLKGNSGSAGGTVGPVGIEFSTNGTVHSTTVTVGEGVGTKGAALSSNYTFVPSILSTRCP
ncbi:MAG: RHS repeat-associated core domain-containing protein [Acidobacteriales bacterium]|nr:RHS repeat-associated core domain-containing protein [Terriglobales bacterium]